MRQRNILLAALFCASAAASCATDPRSYVTAVARDGLGRIRVERTAIRRTLMGPRLTTATTTTSTVTIVTREEIERIVRAVLAAETTQRSLPTPTENDPSFASKSPRR